MAQPYLTHSWTMWQQQTYRGLLGLLIYATHLDILHQLPLAELCVKGELMEDERQWCRKACEDAHPS